MPHHVFNDPSDSEQHSLFRAVFVKFLRTSVAIQDTTHKAPRRDTETVVFFGMWPGFGGGRMMSGLWSC